MSVDLVIAQVDSSLKPSAEKKLRDVVADAYSFIRGAEANQAFATVTLDTLIGEQIKRNGESSRSNSAQYDPYSYDPAKPGPSGLAPATRANFLGASDTEGPTKLDRVLAIQNNIVDTITQIKGLQLVDVADAKAYNDAAALASPET